MAHTPEQREQHPLCGAKNRSDGKPCRLFAGQGTEHPGVGRCSLHGGNTPSHQKAAAVEQAQRRFRELGRAIDVSPVQLMAGNVHLAAGHLTVLTQMVSELDDMDTPEARAVIRLWTEERKLSSQIAKLAADMGVADRITSLAEQQTQLVAGLIEAVAGDIDLTPDQKRKLGPAVRAHLALLQAGDPEEAAA